MRQIWQTELDSHIADLADELGSEAEARQRFGNVAAIGQQLSAIHPWLAAYGDWIVLGAIVLSCIPLAISANLFANTIPGLVAERLLVWWWGVILLLGSMVVLKWQNQLINPQHKILIVYALSTGFVISVSITTILDVNNFETALYNALFSTVVGGAAWLIWSKLTITQKHLLLYGAAGLLILFAWREQGWLEAVVFPGCLYLQPDPLVTAPSQCTQVSWFHPLLLLVYAKLILSLGFITHYCYKLWKDSTLWYRKVITTAVFALLPITPILVSGVNQAGQLDVLSWKQDIYTAYVDILGRRPEQKDYDFYAQTRSYQHLSEVREVLYASQERRIKIELLFQEVGRTPTTEEIDYYADSVMTIAEIRSDLETND